MEQGLTCLSMHQPWASLLVYGIKRIEGRDWPTNFRGRLWIHATSKVPEPQEVMHMEDFYRQVHAMDGNAVVFPEAYPPSALLGSVELVDCLPADTIAAWPDLPESLKMEVGSAHGFLCQAPLRAIVLHPLKGQPKLWPLPKKLAATASLALKPCPHLVPFSWGPALQAKREQEMLLEQMAQLNKNKPGSWKRAVQQQEQEQQDQQAAGSDAADAGDAAAGQDYSSPEAVQKRLKQLQKKLRQVERIQEKQATGAALEPEEVAKMGQKAGLEAEVQDLEQALQMLLRSST